MKKNVISILKVERVKLSLFYDDFFVFHAVVGILAGSFFGVQLVFLVFFVFYLRPLSLNFNYTLPKSQFLLLVRVNYPYARCTHSVQPVHTFSLKKKKISKRIIEFYLKF